MILRLQKVTPRESKPRISRTKGHLSKRTAFVREIVKEVSGYVVSYAYTPTVDEEDEEIEECCGAADLQLLREGQQ